MRVKYLTIGDEQLLLEFLQWLNIEALELWHPYGKIFDINIVSKILADFNTVKIAGIRKIDELTTQEAYTGNHEKERMIVFGHLYKFDNDSCRLGIIAGVTGKGYGTKMMKVLIDHARKMGCKKIYLSTFKDNYPALHLYKKFGFKIIMEYNDRPRFAYEMELEIQ
jgi:RimJ/RimL family protein N-acetyltransferase